MTLNENDFQRLYLFVKNKYGIDLEKKRTLIEARLAFDISRRGFNSFKTYIDIVTAFPEGEECQHMINRLSTNYSFFFRETSYASHLKNKALPELLRYGRKEISVWSAGCSGGQEAYTCAMILASISQGEFSFHITGTDVNTEMLKKAKAGIYPRDEIKNIPVAYRKYVNNIEPNSIEITDDIKQCVSWENKNLMDYHFPESEYDIIFCRNVLIYFSPETRSRIAVNINSALKQGGYLYTGAMEAMSFRTKRYTYIAPSIYRKGQIR